MSDLDSQFGVVAFVVDADWPIVMLRITIVLGFATLRHSSVAVIRVLWENIRARYGEYVAFLIWP